MNVQTFSTNLSPLDRLEKQSRSLAGNLDPDTVQNDPVTGSHSGPKPSSNVTTVSGSSSSPSPSGSIKSPVTNENQLPSPKNEIISSPVSISKLSLDDLNTSPYSISGRTSIDEPNTHKLNSRASVSSLASVASVATTAGGILDSFRLSKLPKEVYMEGAIDDDATSSYRVPLEAGNISANHGSSGDRKSIAGAAMRSQFQSFRNSTSTITPVNYIDRTPGRPQLNLQSSHRESTYPEVNHHAYRDSTISTTSSVHRPASSYYSALHSPSSPEDASSFYSSKSRASSRLSQSTIRSPPSDPHARRTSHNSLSPHSSPISPAAAGAKLNQYFFAESSAVRDRFQRSHTSHTIASPITTGSSTPGTFNSSGSSSSGKLAVAPPLKRNPASADPALGGSSIATRRSIVSDKLFSDMTAEEHTATGIALHEQGQLREASYHWQYSAQHGDLTGMLLYGLALRHGWGVRQNPAEAVQWLKKAMELSLKEYDLSELFVDSKSSARTSTSTSRSSDSTENDGAIRDSSVNESRKSRLNLGGNEMTSKTKLAQIALALYELGMSYLHSWGIEKDEAMALKSFEMAGNLGDADALCEAAALYMHNGPGRKKDLMMAAKLYRRAGDLGANMVGNSWIYKSKYMEDKKDKEKDKKKEKEKEKKKR